MVDISHNVIQAAQGFVPLQDVTLFSGKASPTTMKLFMPRINGREFDYIAMKDSLLEALTDYSLSRRTIQRYIDRQNYRHMTDEARAKFRTYLQNKGELGEFILFVLLEGHLHAPKILSKMALKTDNNDYVKGSDGVHFLRLSSGRYHIIFGESKLYTDLTSGFHDAFRSISTFISSGKEDELRLISSQIDNEGFDDEDKEIITQLLYPARAKADFKSSDAFGIFVGFEITVPDEKLRLKEDDFERWIKQLITSEVTSRVATIERQIENQQLQGKNFYVYLMPFTNLDETRGKLLEGLVS